MNRYIIYGLALLMTVTGLASCEKDYINPGAATEEQVLNSPEGLIGLAVGLQRRWTIGRQSPVYTTITGSGFSTEELRLINPGNVDENDLSIGYQTLTPSNSLVNQIWSQSLLTRNEAQKVLDNLSVIPDQGTRAGLLAYTSIFYALANGTLANFFEQAPVETAEDARFVDRQMLYEDAIAQLEEARAALTGATVPQSFYNRIPRGIDLLNTVNALIARYSLQAGRYQQAIEAADRVNLSVASTFAYDNVNPNPIAFISITTNNVYQPVDLTLGLPEGLRPDTDDPRLAFYFQNTMPDNNDFRAGGFFDANTDALPIYLPGEMLLIKAEAYARLNQLDEAIEQLNTLLMKTPADDPFGIGADAPAYSGPVTVEAILTEIYRQRAIELVMSGQRLADSRRFNRPGPNDPNPERNRNFYPYPNSERDNNPNTPDDPVI